MNIKEEIKKALDDRKIANIDDFELQKENFIGFIKDAQENMGMNIAEGRSEILSYKLLDYCKYYKYLTLRDVENILHFGSLGAWGESYRLNMQVVNKWFSEYCKERSNVMQDLQRSDICTTEDRLQFLYKNRDKLPYFKKLCDTPRIPMRTGLKRINEI